MRASPLRPGLVPGRFRAAGDSLMTIHSSAKINLTLDVLARRRDGYHELQSVVHAVGLWDTLRFTFDFNAPAGVQLTCNRPDLCGDDNLCLKAVRAWMIASESAGWMGPLHLHLHLEKRIPSGAGLGGGSGNAAATLLAMNRYHRDLLREEQLLHVAAHIGADVPFFLMGGCALMEGIGDKLSPLPALDGWLVIVQPPHGLSTPAVYRAWDELNQPSGRATPRLQGAMAAHDLSGAGLTLDDLQRAAQKHVALAHFDLRAVAKAMGNDLEAAARHLGLDARRLENLLRAHGALGAAMTGSGSAVFGLFESEAAAREAAARIEARRDKLSLSFVAAVPLCGDALEFPEASDAALK